MKHAKRSSIQRSEMFFFRKNIKISYFFEKGSRLETGQKIGKYLVSKKIKKLNIEKLTKDINSEIVVIGGGYTGLLCAINLIENHNLDVILVEDGKIGWGASSRHA